MILWNNDVRRDPFCDLAREAVTDPEVVYERDLAVPVEQRLLQG